MATDTGLNVAANDVVFSAATLWGKLPGSGSYDVPFGSLQDCKLSVKYTLKELMDPQFLSAIAVGTEKQEFTFTAKWGKLRSRALFACLGGSQPVTSDPAGTTITTLSIGADNSGPIPFAAQLKSSSATNSMVTGIIYAGICESLTLDFKMRDFVMPDFSCKLFVDPVTSKVLDIIMLGDQTTDTGGAAPAAPGGVTATAGGAGTALITLGWTTSAGAASYSVYRSTSSGGPYIWVGDTASLKFADIGVSATTYYYVVTAVSANGASAYSTQVSAAAP